MSAPISVFGNMAKDSTVRQPSSLHERIQLEGEPHYVYVPIQNTTLTAPPDQVLGSLTFPSLTRAMWVESMQLSSNRQVDVQVNLRGLMAGHQQTHRIIVGPGNSVVIPVRQLFRPSVQTSQPNSLGDVRVRSVLDEVTTGASVFCTLAGTSVYDDFNYGADKIMLVLGDSITNGTSGISAKTDSMEWKVRQYFRDKGVNLRTIGMSASGRSSVDFERARAFGRYDQIPTPDYVHYQLGTNDAGQGTSVATFKANVAAMIAHKRRHWPKAMMVVYGSTPMQNDTSETALAALRTAAQQAVTEAADPKVLYCSLATAFDRKVESNYSADDTSGSKLHPNATGHAAAYSVIESFLTAQNVRL